MSPIRAAYDLSRVESIVLVLIAVVLAVLAILLLGTTVVASFNAVATGAIRDLAIVILRTRTSNAAQSRARRAPPASAHDTMTKKPD